MVSSLWRDFVQAEELACRPRWLMQSSAQTTLAKLRALPFQWQLLVLWAPLHDCRNRGRKWEKRIQEEHKNWEDIPATSMRFDAEHLSFIPIRLTWLGMISMCTFPQHPSPLSVPSTLSSAPQSQHHLWQKTLKAHTEGKDTDKFALVEVKEKSLNEQEEQDQSWFSNYCFK